MFRINDRLMLFVLSFVFLGIPAAKAAPTFATAPLSKLGFGDVVTTSYAIKGWTVKNTGSGYFTINSIYMASTGSNYFSVYSLGTCTVGKKIYGPDGSCIFKVKFAPKTTGTFSRYVKIATSIGTNSRENAGKGVSSTTATANICGKPNPLELYGDGANGGVTLTNRGQGTCASPSGTGSITITSIVQDSGFGDLEKYNDNCTGKTLSVGQTCTTRFQCCQSCGDGTTYTTFKVKSTALNSPIYLKINCHY